MLRQPGRLLFGNRFHTPQTVMRTGGLRILSTSSAPQKILTSRQTLSEGAIRSQALLSSPLAAKPHVAIQLYVPPTILALRPFATSTSNQPPQPVSTSSTTRAVLSEISASQQPGHDDVDMGKAIRNELNAIKETFDLGSVPREAYVLGLAGVVPYLTTSFATVFCVRELTAAPNTILLNPETAQYVLHMLEVVQIGYGAVLLSFLGAIHWGLAWANYGARSISSGNLAIDAANTAKRQNPPSSTTYLQSRPKRQHNVAASSPFNTYRRYIPGIVAPAIAWPTLLIPSFETALVGQFLAFTWLYHADVAATKKGWTPPWYGTYRFVLTLLVGASIVVTLMGRGGAMVGTETRGVGDLPDVGSIEGKRESGRAIRDRLEASRAEFLDAQNESESAGDGEEEDGDEGGEKEEENDSDKGSNGEEK